MLNHLTIRRFYTIGVSVVLIALAVWLSGFEKVLRGLVGFPPWAVASIMALLAMNLILVDCNV